MKIWCQLPQIMPESDPMFTGYYAMLREAYDKVKRPDTETIIRDVPQDAPDAVMSPDEITLLGRRFLNDRAILKSMLQAEGEGCDAVAGACFFDGGIREAQQMMTIPVVGPALASMHLACLLGTKFATITSDARWIPAMEKYVEETGMREHAITVHPVRALTVTADVLFGSLGSGDYRPVVGNFIEIGKACMADGADVLIAGCGLYAPMLTLSGVSHVEGAAVIDPMLASLKAAETLVDYKRGGLAFKATAGLFVQ